MAHLDFEFDDEFINQLGSMAQVERYAPKMIDEALPIVQKGIIANLQQHSKTGALVRAIKIKKSRRVKNGGFYGYITADGADADGTRNAEKFVYLEYGTSRQAAQGIIQRTIRETQSEVNEKMQEVFNREAFKEK